MPAWIHHHAAATLCLTALAACQLVYDADDFRDPNNARGDAAPDAPRADGPIGPMIDAATDGPVTEPDGGSLCATLCTEGECIQGSPDEVCLIDCGNGKVDCAGVVQCPPGLHCIIGCAAGDCPLAVDCSQARFCNINCVGDGACLGDITCSDGGCQLLCTGDQSCNGNIQCGAGLCHASCQGAKSCGGGIDCRNSCDCDINCTATDSCGGTISCPAGCDDAGGGCTNTPIECRACM